MGVYIKGMEMPIERESFNLTIKYNGTVIDTETGIQVAEAYELPPHGRLIDADALVKAAVEDESHDVWGAYAREVIVHKIQNAPTVIPAEEGKT